MFDTVGVINGVLDGITDGAGELVAMCVACFGTKTGASGLNLKFLAPLQNSTLQNVIYPVVVESDNVDVDAVVLSVSIWIALGSARVVGVSVGNVADDALGVKSPPVGKTGILSTRGT